MVITRTRPRFGWLNITLVAINAVIWCYALKYLLEAFNTFDRITGYIK